MYKYIVLFAVLLAIFCAHASFADERPTPGESESHAAQEANMEQDRKNLTDYEAIRNLVIAERIYRVSHRTKELMECYAPDARISTSWQSGGVSSFAGKHPVDADKSLPIVNRCNPPLLRIKNSRAVVEYPMTTTREVIVNDERAVLTSFMLLIYQVEKIKGGWKILAMDTINEYDTLAPAIPGADLKINPDNVKDLRVSYRWLSYARRQAGGTISQELPGTDRPETVEKVYADAYGWLNQDDGGKKD